MSESQTQITADASSSRDGTRKRIIAAAIEILTREGREAVTTRAVADAAGVQAPAIYRLFTDKKRSARRSRGTRLRNVFQGKEGAQMRARPG